MDKLDRLLVRQEAKRMDDRSWLKSSTTRQSGLYHTRSLVKGYNNTALTRQLSNSP